MLSGLTPVLGQARWQRLTRFQLDGLSGYRGLARACAVQVDVFTAAPEAGLAPAGIAPVAIWITPLWPADSVEIATCALLEVVVKTVARPSVQPLVADLVPGDPFVTLVINEVGSAHVDNPEFVQLIAGDIWMDVSIDIHWPTHRRSPESIAAAFGERLPYWPYGCNTAEDVGTHVAGHFQRVRRPGHLQSERLVVDYAVNQSMGHGDDDLAALARTLDRARHFHSFHGNLPSGMYLAAVADPPELPEALPAAGSAFDAVDRLLREPTVPRPIGEAVRRTLGDVAYTAPSVLDLDEVEHRLGSSIRAAIRSGEVVNGPYGTRLSQLRQAAAAGQDLETRIRAIATSDPDRPAYAILRGTVATWIAPAVRGDAAQGISLLPFVPHEVLIVATSASLPERSRYGGWVFSPESAAVPLPIRDDGFRPSWNLVGLFVGDRAVLDLIRSLHGRPREEPFTQLDWILSIPGRQVLIPWTDLRRWVVELEESACE